MVGGWLLRVARARRRRRRRRVARRQCRHAARASRRTPWSVVGSGGYSGSTEGQRVQVAPILRAHQGTRDG